MGVGEGVCGWEVEEHEGERKADDREGHDRRGEGETLRSSITVGVS